MFHTRYHNLLLVKLSTFYGSENGKGILEAYSWYPSDFTQYVFPFLILYPLSVINFIHKYNNVMSLEDYSSKSLNWAVAAGVKSGIH